MYIRILYLLTGCQEVGSEIQGNCRAAPVYFSHGWKLPDLLCRAGRLKRYAIRQGQRVRIGLQQTVAQFSSGSSLMNRFIALLFACAIALVAPSRPRPSRLPRCRSGTRATPTIRPPAIFTAASRTTTAIGKYDVTVGQYTAFLNAVAATDTYGLYNPSMATDLNIAGIARVASSGRTATA